MSRGWWGWGVGYNPGVARLLADWPSFRSHIFYMFASPPICLGAYLLCSFAWKQGKGSGRETVTYGYLNWHLAKHHIISKHRARHSVARQDTHKQQTTSLRSREKSAVSTVCACFRGMVTLASTTQSTRLHVFS